MTSVRLEIKYSNNESAGKCVQCLAEQELYNCLRELLTNGREGKETEEKYEMLVAFLQSPDMIRMRVQSEKLLSEGKKVVLVISNNDGKQDYKLEVI